MPSDYVYRNKDDSRRARIFKAFSEEECHIDKKNDLPIIEKSKFLGWDIDYYSRKDGGYLFTHTSEYAEDLFKTKALAKADLLETTGMLISINPENVTDGWKTSV